MKPNSFEYQEMISNNYDTRPPPSETVVLKHGKYETEVPIYQYLSKPLETNRVAVLLMNSGEMTQVLNATFATIPGLDDGIGNDNKYLVRDLWAHKDMGTMTGKGAPLTVAPHE